MLNKAPGRYNNNGGGHHSNGGQHNRPRHHSNGGNSSNYNNNRNRRPAGSGQGSNQTVDSSGPNVKVRGTIAQVFEKYTAMARDALANGESILAEDCFQYAEHYQRILIQNGYYNRPEPVTSPRLESAEGANAPAQNNAQNTPQNGGQNPDQWSEEDAESAGATTSSYSSSRQNNAQDSNEAKVELRNPPAVNQPAPSDEETGLPSFLFSGGYSTGESSSEDDMKPYVNVSRSPQRQQAQPRPFKKPLQAV